MSVDVSSPFLPRFFEACMKPAKLTATGGSLSSFRVVTLSHTPLYVVSRCACCCTNRCSMCCDVVEDHSCIELIPFAN